MRTEQNEDADEEEDEVHGREGFHLDVPPDFYGFHPAPERLAR